MQHIYLASEMEARFLDTRAHRPVLGFNQKIRITNADFWKKLDTPHHFLILLFSHKVNWSEGTNYSSNSSEKFDETAKNLQTAVITKYKWPIYPIYQPLRSGRIWHKVNF